MSVFVYAAPIRCIDDIELQQLKNGLPDFQQRRFNTKNPGSLFAWVLLLNAVEDAWGLVSLPHCAKPMSGKPYFDELPDMDFSLSHNDSFAVCALSEKPVGCDIESASRKPAAVLMEKTLTAAEYELVHKSSQPEKTFMQLWTLKEAKLKMNGTGLAGGIAKTDMADILGGLRVRVDLGEYYSCFEYKGNFISVCGSDFADRIKEIKI